MKKIFKLVSIALAIVPTSDAFAGHEWSDGTMGPPQSRWYDTTMPTFPAPRSSTTKPAEEPTALCGNSAISNANADTPTASSSPGSYGRADHAQTPPQAHGQDRTAPTYETCSGPAH
jgi:hypothetical protein